MTRLARARIHHAEESAAVAAFAANVGYYLQQQPRQLPSRYFYDRLGSALFDAICRLPWYPLTDGELRLLGSRGGAILSHLGPLSRIVELGAGNGEKLMTLLDASKRSGIDLHLVDISRAALDLASRALSVRPGVRVRAHEANYDDGLERLAPAWRGPGATLMMFLGSNIGNYDPPGADHLLRQMHASLRPGDALLLGADLVKPAAALIQAYDDPLQVTAAFNRNLLVRINRELAADFDLDGFGHRAIWNEAESRVEMHLVSTRRQRVRVPRAGVDITFAPGETIWTESSYKYRADGIASLVGGAGFKTRSQWIDEAAQFSLTLAEV
jgi:L-histidine N-alpha-methyltransferase